MEFLAEIDKFIFYFINVGLSNPLTDWFMPLVTSFKTWLPLYLIGMFYLVFRYKLNGLYMIAFLLLVVGVGDYINDKLFKEIFQRSRPCHIFDDINLLISCGPGKSFPSNHAVNNFSMATYLSFFFKRKIAVFFTFASLVAISRVFVGVHFLSDVISGAFIGFLIAFLIITILKKIPLTHKICELIRIN